MSGDNSRTPGRPSDCGLHGRQKPRTGAAHLLVEIFAAPRCGSIEVARVAAPGSVVKQGEQAWH